MERHGSSVSAAVGGTASLASDLVTITLMSMASGSVTVEPQQKKLPSSMTVARLKQLCERVFKVSSTQKTHTYTHTHIHTHAALRARLQGL